MRVLNTTKYVTKKILNISRFEKSHVFKSTFFFFVDGKVMQDPQSNLCGLTGGTLYQPVADLTLADGCCPINYRDFNRQTRIILAQTAF